MIASKKRNAWSIVGSILKQGVLICLSLTILFPLFWMVSTSLKPSGTEFAFPVQWLPSPVRWKNYVEVFTSLPFGRFTFNSVFVATLATLGQVLSGSMVGFALAQVNFPGRKAMLLVILSPIMLPEAVLLVPTFILFKTLGWVDTFYPLIVPAWFGGRALYIFLARQFFLSIPRDLFDAARMDGASTWRIWWSVAMPLSKPMLVTVALLRFLADWNDFMSPLLYLPSMEHRTLAVGLYTFLSQFGGEWNFLMAAATTMALPLIIMFLFFQRYFVQGISTSGLAGR